MLLLVQFVKFEHTDSPTPIETPLSFHHMILQFYQTI